MSLDSGWNWHIQVGTGTQDVNALLPQFLPVAQIGAVGLGEPLYCEFSRTIDALSSDLKAISFC